MASTVVVLIFVVIVISPDTQARSSFTSSPEIWLSAVAEIDSFDSIPAEAEFRTRSYFESDFVLKNGTDYVVQDATLYAVFSCQSHFPVEWKIPHMEQVDHSQLDFNVFESSTLRISEFYPNSLRPANKYFETHLKIFLSGFQFLSTKFTCTATSSAMVEPNGFFGKGPPQYSSIHLFYAGPQAIEKRGETIKVYVPPFKDKKPEDTVILPCRPATPNITILLEKQVKTRNNPNETATKIWRKYPAPSFVKFDPKVGFTLLNPAALFGVKSYPNGLYRCVAVEEDDSVEGGDGEFDTSNLDADSQIVYINVTDIRSENKSAVNLGFETMLKLEGNGSVTYNNKTFGNYPQKPSPNELICCSGVSNDPPLSSRERCGDQLQCRILLHIMSKRVNSGNLYKYAYALDKRPDDRSDCQRHPMIDDSLAMVCKGDNILFSGFFTTIFAEGLMQVANRSWGFPLTKLVMQPDAMKAPVSQKIWLIVGYPITSNELTLNQHYNRYFGKVFTLTENHYIEDDTYDLMDTFHPCTEHQYYDPEEYDPLEKRLICQETLSDKIAEYPRDVYYEKESLALVCVGWKLLYSKGAHLTINWKNGTVTPVEQAGKNGKHYKTVYFHGGIDGYFLPDLIEYRFGREVLAHKDMVSVNCWMPQLNTNEWDRLVKNLTILSGSLPQFVEGEGNITEQVVYLYLGEDEGKQLECQVVGGAPEPKLDVTKDGKGIFNRYQNVNRLWRRPYQNENFTTMINVTLHSNDTEHSNGTTATVDDGVTIIIIQFGKVNHEMQGVYQCSAGNIRGTVTRTFRVIVIERRSVALPIMITVIIISSIVLIGMGVRHWRQKTFMQSLRGN